MNYYGDRELIRRSIFNTAGSFGSGRLQRNGNNKGIAKGGVKNRNKGRVCLHLLAFSPLRLLAFVSVCLRLFAFARICLRPPLLRPHLRDTEINAN